MELIENGNIHIKDFKAVIHHHRSCKATTRIWLCFALILSYLCTNEKVMGNLLQQLFGDNGSWAEESSSWWVSAVDVKHNRLANPITRCKTAQWDGSFNICLFPAAALVFSIDYLQK